MTCEGEEWKKYRKISAPAFSDVRIDVRFVLGSLIDWRFYFCQRNNKLVWDETIKIMNGLFDEVWAGEDVISLDHTLEITLAVCVYSSLQSYYLPVSLILIFRLLYLSSVLQVIAIDCFLAECLQRQVLGYKCHGTRTRSYQRDTGCRWKKHSTSFLLGLLSEPYSQIGF